MTFEHQAKARREEDVAVLVALAALDEDLAGIEVDVADLDAIEMNGRRPTPIFATTFASEERDLALSGFVSPSGSRARQTSIRGSLGAVAL
ncbi:MAG: hypothetical protein JOY85_21055 [Acidobacteriaceae bacterium]|nr:hypothetical protein [Acidobacteriaceae bacterium]